jgi:hypothetical protein
MRRRITLIALIAATNGLLACAQLARETPPLTSPSTRQTPDLSGEWEFHEEEFVQRFSLDEHGNGRYAWQDGYITTTSLDQGRWLGHWYQAGNDREGDFDVRLSEDGTEAEGTWWYTRIGQNFIPPHAQGGRFVLKRVQSAVLRSTL